MRNSAHFAFSDAQLLRRNILHWAARNPYGVVLYGHPAPDGPAPAEWDLLAGVGAARLLVCPAGQAFERLIDFQQTHPDWLFGYFGYDLKNEVENLHSAHFDGVGFPELTFWAPESVVGLRGGRLEIHSLGLSPQEVFDEINAMRPELPGITAPVTLQPRIPKDEYLETVERIRRHIIAGDVYELNYCQEFYAENARIDPVQVFERLQELSRAPFGAWLRAGGHYALCASPERFLKYANGVLRSQPIKGTRGRGDTPEADRLLREALAANEKDRAENVMIVDLVRNDLARNCLPGSVVVDELFGIYTFPTVHQMISTVSGALRPGVHPIAALRDAFPMGSMTGAPKVMAMQLIELYERSRRGLYSGAIGYIAPNGHFDFNVVIRSILYNAETGYVSASVGGAIVYDSVPEEEYAECLVKVAGMRRALA